MKKFLFLSSAFIMTTLGAFGADGTITGGENTCTVDVLGVSDNNATANTIATWSLIDYECPAGQYLLNSDGTLKCTECPVGSYCPGGKYTVESENNGANTCPTDYTSDAAATAETECYMGCELACTPAQCPKNAAECTPIASNTSGKQYVNGTCDAPQTTCKTAFTCKTGYTARDFMISDIFPVSTSIGKSNVMIDSGEECYGTGKCPDFQEGSFSISSTVFGGDNYSYDKGEIYEYIESGINVRVVCNEYGPDTPGTFTKSYVNKANETKTATMLYREDFNGSENNQYCWARPITIDKYTRDYILFDLGNFEYMENQEVANLFKEIMQKFEENPDYTITEEELEAISSHISSLSVDIPLDQMPWMYIGELPDTNTGRNIQSLVDGNFGWNDGIYAYSDYHAFIDCTFNMINTNWNPDNGGDVIQNQCAYDGSVILPDDPVKPGYTFTGWKLVE